MEVNNVSNTRGEKIEWGGWLNEFLWICAGTNREILRQCPTDYAKYAGTGGTILFTAIMAAISGGYAISFVFKDAPLYVPFGFGIIWGLMIFNLDRFMVNTMYSDGKHTISKAEFLGGLPRIILAIFLGIVISTPIEIRVFQDKIKSQLIIDQGKVGDDVRKAHDLLYQQRKDIEDQIATRNNQLTDLRSGRLDGISGRVADKEKELKEAENRLYNETNGDGVTKQRGYGPAAKQIENQVNRLKEELANLRLEERQNNANNQTYIKQRTISVQNEIDEYNRRLVEVDKKIAEVEKEGREGQKELTGFCAQINALNEIASPSKNLSLFLTRLFISLLFIAIEIIPTLFKMMVASGPYDDFLRAEMHKVRVLSDKRISDLNDEVNTEVQISTQKNKERLAAEALANKELMERIAKAQAELLQTAIDKWREEELVKINQDPSTYIQSNSKA
ncbi:DUF4407 domain-containing protein [Parabacteroides sp. ZJ-118]|uniref:DUF4407 domain-containing protein n=1 Tax=Parabacteroides sp. ZJ-118 TaxID=2709398 RepID=UPI0013ECBAB4|nr:DUF4407 domain-containing protein [Parabacteroides sp. ZJ-118]